MTPETSTVFIVDDEASVRDALRLFLDVSGFRVKTFASGEEFLAAIDPARPGCLVLDVRMPGMSGLEVQQELKRRGITLPIIVITGHGDVAMAVAALKAGGLNFLEKPIDHDMLIADIREALNRDQRAREARIESEAIAERARRLTPRERSVMELAIEGHSNRAIAELLGISIRTVENYRAAVIQKMEAASTIHLVRMALQLTGGDKNQANPE
jgi:RNA polymerase sigma factor (sigma-70 family)